jgi:excisionase family DNA binding protein
MTEAAERLGAGRSTIYKLIARGELEVVHIGRSARVPAEALDDFVRKLRDQTVTNPAPKRRSNDATRANTQPDCVGPEGIEPSTEGL